MGACHEANNDMQAAIIAYRDGVSHGSSVCREALERIAENSVLHATTAHHYLGEVLIWTNQWLDAKYHLEQAYETRYPETILALAELYKEGRVNQSGQVVIPRDTKKVNDYLQEALECGDAAVQQQALKKLELYAEGKYAAACVALAQFYESSGNKNKENINRIIRYYEQAYQFGDTHSLNYLAENFYTGNALFKKNIEKAFAYYLQGINDNRLDALDKLETCAVEISTGHAEYEIAVIYQHKREPDTVVLPWYIKSAQKGFNKAQQQLSLYVKSDGHKACIIAQQYEHLGAYRVAFDYYFLAASQKHQAALTSLVKLLQAYRQKFGDYERLTFQLAGLYVNTFNALSDALHWYKTSFEAGGVQALSALEKLAHQNISIANELAQWHESQGRHQEAFKMYKIAAQQGDAESLQNLETLCQRYPQQSQLLMELVALFYERSNYKKVVQHYFTLRHTHPTSADKIFKQYIHQQPNCLYLLAKAYEHGTHTTADKPLAYQYYAQAALKKHVQAEAILFKAADELQRPSAQYALAQHYYQQQKAIKSAIKYYMLAAQQDYQPAMTHLETTNFDAQTTYYIAQCYEQAIDVNANIKQAIKFYEQALNKGYYQAAVALGDLYQADLPELPRDSARACAYYEKAAKQGNKDAHTCLQRLAVEVNITQQKQVSNLYKFFNEQGNQQHQQQHIRQADPGARNRLKSLGRK